MNADENRHLPVIEDGLEDEAPACSPTNYVSNEEAALLASMRRLREKSMVVRRDLKDADPEDRARLEAELEELREEWRTLAETPRAGVRQQDDHVSDTSRPTTQTSNQ